MAVKQNQRQGNTDELDRLEADKAELLNIKKSLEGQVQRMKADNDFITKENLQLKDALEKAQTKIGELEASAGISVDGESLQSGHVVIATLPLLDTGIFPIPGKINGIPIPRKIEDGVLYETMPAKNAIEVLSEGSGFKRALIGPASLDKLQGSVVKHQAANGIRGTYNMQVTHTRHKVELSKNGPRFIKIEIEESVQKSD